MKITILCSGDELLDGRIINKNQAIIARLLWEAGYGVSQGIAIGDSLPQLVDAMENSQDQSDIVICTGGLGPTDDDRTIEALSVMSEIKLVRSTEIEKRLRTFYQQRQQIMPESNLKQADMPQGSTIIPNRTGTAVGIQCQVKKNKRLVWWFLLPGVTREMTTMVTDHIIPFLDQNFILDKQNRQLTTFKCVGVGESAISDRLQDFYPLPKGLEIRYQVPYPEVHVQLSATGAGLISGYDHHVTQISQLLHDCCYATGSNTFTAVILQKLQDQHQTLAVAESCTGGRIAQMITAIPGSSAVFLQGVVAYHNDAKSQLLGVDTDLIRDDGAVSEPVALAMADGIMKKSGADIGLAVTGIAGPAGGTAEKPVGTVCIAMVTKAGTETSDTHHFSGEREQIQIRSAYAVLAQLF